MSKDDKILLAFCGLVIFTCIIGRFALLGANGYWLDEIMQVQLLSQPTWNDYFQAIPRDKMPFDYIILKIWGHAPSPEWWMRIPSAIFALVPIFLVYFLNINFREKLVAMALVAMNPLAIHLGQELIPYSSAAMFVFLSMFFASKYIEEGRWQWLPPLFLSVLFCGFSNIFSLTSIPCIIIAFLIAWRQKKDRNYFLWANLLGVFLCIIGFFIFLRLKATTGSGYLWTFPSFEYIVRLCGESF